MKYCWWITLFLTYAFLISAALSLARFWTRFEILRYNAPDSYMVTSWGILGLLMMVTIVLAPSAFLATISVQYGLRKN